MIGEYPALNTQSTGANGVNNDLLLMGMGKSVTRPIQRALLRGTDLLKNLKTSNLSSPSRSLPSPQSNNGSPDTKKKTDNTLLPCWREDVPLSNIFAPFVNAEMKEIIIKLKKSNAEKMENKDISSVLENIGLLKKMHQLDQQITTFNLCPVMTKEYEDRWENVPWIPMNDLGVIGEQPIITNKDRAQLSWELIHNKQPDGSTISEIELAYDDKKLTIELAHMIQRIITFNKLNYELEPELLSVFKKLIVNRDLPSGLEDQLEQWAKRRIQD